MIKSTSVLLLMFCSNLLIAQDWLADTCTLKGNVKSVQYSSVENPTLPKEHQYTEEVEYEYNQQGYMTWYNLSGSFFGENANSRSRIYDATGTRCLIAYEMQDGDTASRYDYTYNKMGKVDKAKLYRWGTLIRTFNYIYDQRGFLVEYNVPIPESGYTAYHYFEYNAAGKKTGESENHPSDKEIWSWKYNNQGYLIEEKLIDSNRASTTTIKVNKKGKYSRGKTVDHSKNVRTTDSYTLQFTVNEKGQVMEELKLDHLGNPLYKSTYTYNEYGDALTRNFYGYEQDKTSAYSYAYTYDEQGNWILKTTYISEQIFKEEKRVIVYY